MKKFKVTRDSSKPLTKAEHETLARHLYAILYHKDEIIQILNGRARVKYLDQLCRTQYETGTGNLRTHLDNDYCTAGFRTGRQAITPYYGNEPEDETKCPAPRRRRSRSKKTPT